MQPIFLGSGAWDEYTVRWSAVDQNNVSSPISREIYFAVETKSDHISGKSSFQTFQCAGHNGANTNLNVSIEENPGMLPFMKP